MNSAPMADDKRTLRHWGELTVGDLMSRAIIKVPVSAELRHARHQMELANVRHVAVVDPNDELVGIVSDRDLLRALALGESNSTSIEHVMTRRVCTIAEDAPLLEALRLMMERHIGALPVEGAHARLSGILTETDLLLVLQAVLVGRAPHAFLVGL